MNRAVVSSYTARTTAFASATGITDVTILGALNTFDLGLISNSLDTKMYAIYPMVGGTSTTCKYNFMDARDLDVAFRLQFFGGGTFSSTGYKPNGVNASADTFFKPSINLPSMLNVHLSAYTRTQIRGGVDVGVSVLNNLTLSADLNLSGIYGFSNISSQYAANFSSNPSIGFFIANRESNVSNKIIRNGTILNTNTANVGTGSTPDTFNVYLASLNINGGSLFSAREQAFASIGSGLSNTDSTAFYNLVQNMQTTLSRQV
jgi:hypothetical protein